MTKYFVLKRWIKWPGSDEYSDMESYDGDIWGPVVPCAMTREHANSFLEYIHEIQNTYALERGVEYKPFEFDDVFDEASQTEIERMGTSDCAFVPEGWDAEEWKRENIDWQ